MPYNYNTETIKIKADIPEQIDNNYYINEISNIIEFYRNVIRYKLNLQEEEINLYIFIIIIDKEINILIY